MASKATDRERLLRAAVLVATIVVVSACGEGRARPGGSTGVEAGSDAAPIVAILVDAAPARDNQVITPERAAVLDAVEALADAVVAAHGCPARVLGKTLRSATMLCLGVIAAAVTSAALEDPGRMSGAVARLDALIGLAAGRAARRGFAASGSVVIGGAAMPRSVLYRGVLALMLAGLERLAPKNARTPAFDAIATSLAADLSVGVGWLPTYAPDEIWPCDHAPAASALRLHARLRGNAATELVADAVATRLRAALELPDGFPTRVTATGATADATMRGTTLAFAAGFLLAGEPQLASEFAALLVSSRCDQLVGGASACREWARGVERDGDAASGPIIRGYATGTTALAIAASRALDDPHWNSGLLVTAYATGAAALDPTTQPLEVALIRWGQTARSWE